MRIRTASKAKNLHAAIDEAWHRERQEPTRPECDGTQLSEDLHESIDAAWKGSKMNHYTINEVGEMLGISRSTIVRARQEGTLKVTRVGKAHVRISEQQIADYLSLMNPPSQDGNEAGRVAE